MNEWMSECYRDKMNIKKETILPTNSVDSQQSLYLSFIFFFFGFVTVYACHIFLQTCKRSYSIFCQSCSKWMTTERTNQMDWTANKNLTHVAVPVQIWLCFNQPNKKRIVFNVLISTISLLAKKTIKDDMKTF